MKKQDGYVLIFVLVVLGVVVLFTTIISTAAIRSYQRQAKSEAQMAQYYEEQGVHQALEGIITWPDNGDTLKGTINTVLSAAGFDTGVCSVVLTTEDEANPGSIWDIANESYAQITSRITGGTPLIINCAVTESSHEWNIEYEAIISGGNIELTPISVTVQEVEVTP